MQALSIISPRNRFMNTPTHPKKIASRRKKNWKTSRKSANPESARFDARMFPVSSSSSKEYVIGFAVGIAIHQPLFRGDAA